MTQLYTPWHMPKCPGILLHTHLLSHVHCCSIHNCKEMKTTYVTFNNWGLENKTAVHIHNEIIINYKLISCLHLEIWHSVKVAEKGRNSTQCLMKIVSWVWLARLGASFTWMQAQHQFIILAKKSYYLLHINNRT